jgi:hypothetical protein
MRVEVAQAAARSPYRSTLIVPVVPGYVGQLLLESMVLVRVASYADLTDVLFLAAIKTLPWLVVGA